ncbi:autophagy-related protein 13-domain-containing protein [Chlamydoabsidia padenii]|nr:autophagy-related protein 13-domain-containing protein [Chlamydoabsidia padenii]
MLPSTRRSRSSSALQRVNIQSPPIQQRNTLDTPHAIEDAMTSTLFIRQENNRSSSTMDRHLNSMLQNFYMKTVNIIVQARHSTKMDRINRWFDLIMLDKAALRVELHFYKSKVYYPCEEPPPTLTIHIYLDTTHLSQEEVHNIMEDYMHQHNMNPSHDKKKIILESWALTFRQSAPILNPSSIDMPRFYKHSIIFFRALHSFARLIPGYSLHRRLQEGDNRYSLCYRIGTGTCSYLHDELPPDTPLIKGDHQKPPTVYKFSDVLTPIGTLQLKVKYRSALLMNGDYGTGANQAIPHIYKVNHQLQQRTTLSRSQSSPILHEQHGLTVSSTTKRDLLHNQHGPSPHSSDILSKHAPILCISPFKSPSLSPLPRDSQSSSASTSNSKFIPVIEKSKSSTIHCSSTSKIGEFSSSFDKYKHRHSTTRRHTSERYPQKSIHDHSLMIDQDNDLVAFVRLVNEKPDLKLFQESKWTEHPGTSLLLNNSDDSYNDGSIWSPSPLVCSYLGTCGSLERSKTSLDYFHALRYAQSDLSEFMASEITTTSSTPSFVLPCQDIGTPRPSTSSSTPPLTTTTREDSSIYKDRSTLTDIPPTDKPQFKQRYQQRSTSSGTRFTMGTLMEEDGSH